MRAKFGLIIVLIALLLAAAGTASARAKPPTPATIFTGATAADAMRQAVTYLDETGSDPMEVYVTGPATASDALWRVAVVEAIWQ